MSPDRADDDANRFTNLFMLVSSAAIKRYLTPLTFNGIGPIGIYFEGKSMRSTRNLALTGIGLALGLVALAGCSSDSTSSDTATEAAAETAAETPAEAGAETAAETPAEAAAETAAEAAGDRSDWPTTIVVAAVPSEESSSLQQSYEPLLETLREQLGVDVEFFQATDYAGIIEAQNSGKVDLAQYGPFSYVLAKTRGADIDVAGVMTDAPDAEPGYQSYGIALGTNDAVNSIEDFKGKTVCFVDPASTSGYLYPSEGLLSAGVDLEADITPVFAGGHDASVLAVKNGDCEVGFAFDAMVDSNLIESGDLQPGEIKTVWKSEVIAGSPMAIRNGLPASLDAEIRRIVLEDVNVDKLIAAGKCTSTEDCGLTDENVWGWVSKPDSFFDGVRKVCEVTGSENCQ